MSRLARRHTPACCLALLALLLLSGVAAVGLGPVSIPFGQVWQVILHRLTGLGSVEQIPQGVQNIIWDLRLPRVLAGMAVGCALTLSGVGMQALTRNPLADPYLLGVSSGASLGAVCAMLLPQAGRLSISGGSFLGAVAAIALVYGVARGGGEVTPIRLVLVGMAVSSLMSAATNYLVYTAPDDAAVREATFWMLGGLGSVKWEQLPALLLSCLLALVLFFLLARPLNAMAMGSRSAATLGVEVGRISRILVLSTALVTACAVSVSGCIGFVGLVVPHLVRALSGADHRRLVPLSALFGALFLLWADVGARLLAAPAEIPVGILTAALGAPVFLWMVQVRRYSFSG